MLARVVASVLAVSACVACATSAFAAPPLAGWQRPPWRAWTQGGWDPTATIALGVDRRVARPTPITQLFVDAQYRAPLVLAPWLSALGLEAGATFLARAPGAAPLGVALSVHPFLRTANDDTASMTGLGVALSARPGVYFDRGSATLDVALATVLTTHVAHSSAVKDLFGDRPAGSVEGPRDGWFALASRRARLGVAGAWAPVEAVSLHAVVGYTWTRQLEGIASNPPTSPVPFYVEMGGGYRW
jgi:hypothetical protein